MIEKQEVTAATCGWCDHTDYAPIEDEALLALTGFQVRVVHKDMFEEGYACKTVHVNRVAKSLAEKLHKQLSPPAKQDDPEDGSGNETGLLAG